MTDAVAPIYNVLRYPLHKMANEELPRLTGGLSGPGHLRWPKKRPILTLRCPVGHATARVYSTRRGPLFVSWRLFSWEDQQHREGVQVTSPRGPRQELADLLDVDPDGAHPALLGSCRCGQVRQIEREELGSHLRSFRAGRTTKRDLVI